MNGRDGLQSWSVSCGTWFQTQVRLSIFLLVPIPIVLFRLGLAEWKLGLAILFLLSVSILLHEFGHVFMARLTGGSGDEILLWPLGGLAFVRPAETFLSQLLTAAAGPLVNLALCGASFWWIWNLNEPGAFRACFSPLTLPPVTPSAEWTGIPVTDLMMLFFWINWLGCLINLIPVYPLDGGQMLQACLTARYGSEASRELSLRIGLFAAVIAVVAGMVVNNTLLLSLGWFLLLMNVVEMMQARSSEGYEESFMGYDFSQGYTSLEKNRETKKPAPPGFFEQWRAKRRAEKERRAQLQAEQEQQLIDALLEKVHTQGMAALTDAERRTLDKASAKLRGKGKPGQ